MKILSLGTWGMVSALVFASCVDAAEKSAPTSLHAVPLRLADIDDQAPKQMLGPLAILSATLDAASQARANTNVTPGATLQLNVRWQTDNVFAMKSGVLAVVLRSAEGDFVSEPLHSARYAVLPPLGAVRPEKAAAWSEQVELRIPADVQAGNLSLELVWIADHKQVAAIPVATFAVDIAKRVPAGMVAVDGIAPGSIVIDGDATDVAWQQTLPFAFTTGESSPNPSGETTGRLLWDPQYLYLFVDVRDTNVASPYVKRDDPLWKADVVEIFIDVDGNQRGYVELQVSPQGTIFDAYFPGGRGDPSLPGWNSGIVAAAKVRGTLNSEGDADGGYSVEAAIPWQDVWGQNNLTFEPKAGATLRANVVRVDQVGGRPAVSGYAKIRYADFHSLDRLLPLYLRAAPLTAPPVENAKPGVSP